MSPLILRFLVASEFTVDDQHYKYRQGSDSRPDTRLARDVLTGIVFCFLAFSALTVNAQIQQAYLKASNAGSDFDAFGYAVATSGNTVVVGANNERSGATGINGDQSDISANDAGAVYVFVRDGSSWSQQAYLKASNTDANDYFGHSVSISGDTLVVGAIGEASNATGVNNDQHDNSAADAGAVYVFVRDGSSWSQQAYLKASNTDAGDIFGFRVALSGNTLLISARHEDSNATGIDGVQSDNSAEDSGAVYVFQRNGTSWSQQAYLKASNTDAGDVFGRSVDISGETIVIGSAESSRSTGVNGDQADNSADFSGAAYVFIRNGTVWNQQAYLKASNTDRRDLFAYDVAISGDMVAVGAPIEASSAKGFDGDQGDNSQTNAGAAYVFTRNSETWSQRAYIKASNTESGDVFGRNLALSAHTLVVSSEREDSSATGINGDQSDNSKSNAGAAYVFNVSGGTWSQKAYLKASNTDSVDEFGWYLALSDSTLVIGAPGEDSGATIVNGDQEDNSVSGAGAAYVFLIEASKQDFTINAGHSGAWFNPDTSGQGQFIDVVPEDRFMFISWFTFTDAASDNLNEQQWYTAQGNYSGDTAVLDLFETLGGKFDDPQEVTTTQVGEVMLSFSDCGNGEMSYSFDEEELQGELSMIRVIPGSSNVCEELNGNSTQTVDINAGMNGAWIDPDTSGQGYFIDAHPDPEGGNVIFVSWFTYGDATASGQRWLTAQGGFEGSTAEIDVFETTGGSFDDPEPVSITKVGTMSLDFTDCSNAQLTYSLPADPAEGDIAITRVILGSQALCEELSGED